MYGEVYIALDIEFLHMLAATLRFGNSSSGQRSGPMRQAFFDLKALVWQIQCSFYSSNPIKVFGCQKHLTPYLTAITDQRLELIDVPNEFGDQSAIDVAIAYDLAAKALPSYWLKTIVLGTRHGLLRGVSDDLRKAGKRVVSLDLESEKGSPNVNMKSSDLHLIPHWAWCQPKDLPLKPDHAFGSIGEGSFTTTLLPPHA